MQRHSGRSSWQSLALAMVVSGCETGSGENTGPVGPEPGLLGSYRLVAPFTAFDGRQSDSAWGEYQIRVVAVEGRLQLTADRGYEHQLQLETYIDGMLAHRSRWGDRGHWQQRGDTLAFGSGYIEDLAFLGVRRPTGLALLQDVVGEGVVAAFPFALEEP